MEKIINHNKGKIIFGSIFSLVFFSFSALFILTPHSFVRNAFTTTNKIQLIGSIGVIYFSILTLSFFKLSQQKKAIVISQDHLIDNSRFESIGKIEWQEIIEIKKLKKSSLEIIVREGFIKNTKQNILKKFLRYMHNWNNKSSIVISTTLLNCSRQELYESIVQNKKRHTTHCKLPLTSYI